MNKLKLRSYSIDLSVLLHSSSILEYKQNEVIEGEKLGIGGFSKVVEGMFKTLKFAIKKIKQYNSKAMYRELYIMKKFTHPYIPKLYGIIKKPIKNFSKKGHRNTLGNTSELHESILNLDNKEAEGHMSKIHKPTKFNLEIILEIVEGKSLEKLLTQKDSLTKIEKIIILLNLATVLEYLHGFNLIHRDLKPDNIMIDKKFEFKLLDFGISKVGSNNNNSKTVSIGTMSYMAPENFTLNLNDEEENENEDSQNFKDLKEINEKVDVWAFGCIVQEVFTGVKPWSNKAKSNNKILSLLYKKVPFEISNLVDNPEQKNLIQKCVEVEAYKRISIKEAKILLLEILLKEFKLQSKIHNLNEDSLDKGMISIYKMFESITHKEKFHLIRKVQFYIFEYFCILNNKNNAILLKNKPENIKDIDNQIFESKFLHDFENMDHVKNKKIKGIDMFLKELKLLEVKKLKSIFNLEEIIKKYDDELIKNPILSKKSILKNHKTLGKKNKRVSFKGDFSEQTFSKLRISPRILPSNNFEKVSKKYVRVERVNEFHFYNDKINNQVEKEDHKNYIQEENKSHEIKDMMSNPVQKSDNKYPIKQEINNKCIVDILNENLILDGKPQKKNFNFINKLRRKSITSIPNSKNLSVQNVVVSSERRNSITSFKTQILPSPIEKISNEEKDIIEVKKSIGDQKHEFTRSDNRFHNLILTRADNFDFIKTREIFLKNGYISISYVNWFSIICSHTRFRTIDNIISQEIKIEYCSNYLRSNNKRTLTEIKKECIPIKVKNLNRFKENNLTFNDLNNFTSSNFAKLKIRNTINNTTSSDINSSENQFQKSIRNDEKIVRIEFPSMNFPEISNTIEGKGEEKNTLYKSNFKNFKVSISNKKQFAIENHKIYHSGYKSIMQDRIPTRKIVKNVDLLNQTNFCMSNNNKVFSSQDRTKYK